MRDIRLGDDIDDFCVRCKRITNHAVVSVISAVPAKVRCRTCHSDHDYRHEQAPPPKVDARKAALFQEVLKKVNPDAAVVDAMVVDAMRRGSARDRNRDRRLGPGRQRPRWRRGGGGRGGRGAARSERSRAAAAKTKAKAKAKAKGKK